MKSYRFSNSFVALFIVCQFVAGAALRAQTAGTIDSTFNANLTGSGGNVSVMAVQPDGAIILAGQFSSVLGVTRGNIARIASNGTLDTTFDPETNGQVNCAALQPDGSIVIGGAFTTLQPNGASSPTTRNYIARLNSDGTLDAGFNPNLDNVVYCAAVQPDGAVVFGGFFQFLGGQSLRQSLARVNADGSVDTSFAPQPSSAVFSIIVLSGGQLLVGGQFTTFNTFGPGAPVTEPNVARLNSDGAVDPSFDPEPDNRVATMALQPDGKVILGGSFEVLRPNGGAKINRASIARVNSDGSLDSTFAPSPNSSLDSLVLQTNGQIVIGGAFNTILPAGASTPTTRHGIARLNAAGSIDANFDPETNGTVNGVALESNGEVLVGGTFTSLQPDGAANPTAVNFLALLNNDAATHSLTAPDATQVQWQRGGTSPEATAVTFDRTPDGITWFPLGSGVRVTGGWAITGLSLNGFRGTIRALAQTPGGQYNSSPSTLEDTTSFDFDTVGGFTVAPILTAPAANTESKSPVTVTFTLLETALRGSVMLSFGNTQTMTLSASEETAGTHTFTFDPANPVGSSGGAVASLPSGSIPDGAYTVTLSYQDTLAHPAATASSANFTIETVTPAPTLSAPVTNGNINGVIGSNQNTTEFTLPEAALSGSVELVFDNGTTQYILVLSSAEESSGGHTIFFDPANPTLNDLDGNGVAAIASGPTIPDGTYSVWVSYQDALGNPAAISNMAANVTVDTVTQAPTLTAPAANSYVGNPITVAFLIPEAAGAASLSFGTTTLGLDASLYASGPHTFTFDPANPVASSGGAIDSGSPIADGSYTVTFSYQDAVFNTAATATVSNVVVDTTPPTINAPTNGFTPLVVYVGTTLADYTGQAVAQDANGAQVTQQPPAGTTLNANTTVTLTATDPAQNQATLQFLVSVRPTLAVNTVALTASIDGDAPPGAGDAGGPPADAKLAGFGTPAIDADGNLAFLAQWTSATGGKGKGLFTEGLSTSLCLAKIGDAVPGITGAKFKSFTDPVIDAGSVACIASFTGAGSGGGSAVVSYNSTGVFSLVARAGEAGTLDGAKFASFKEAAIVDGYVGFLGELATGTGTVLRTTAANAKGLWVADGSDAPVLILRQGQQIGSKTIKTLVSFATGNGSPGQGRGWLVKNPSPGARVLALCLFTDKTQAVVSVDVESVDVEDAANPTVLSQSGVANGTGSPALANASFASYGLPTMNIESASAFAAVLTAGQGGVAKAAAHGVFKANNGMYETIAQVAGDAGETGAKFSQLRDPVLAADGGLAFPATLAGAAAKGVAAATLWWQPPGGSLGLLAQGGAEPGDLPGARWKGFTSLAIAANRGPIFSATLESGVGGIPKGNPAGVWAVDFLGQPRLLFRTGSSVGGKTVKSFTLLNATAGSTGVTRSVNDGQQVVWLATFTDKSQAIVVTETP